MMQKGIFTISLDFELFWGVRDHRTLVDYGKNIRNVHEVIPRLLQLFQKYNVHCTWATVGFLFFNNKEELQADFPASLPEYEKPEYDPYNYIRQNELEPLFHFALPLIEKIKNTPGQEICTHTFSHFYALEKNTTINQFSADLKAALKGASKNDIKLTSIVFPRNQYSDAHIIACRESGIQVYRGNEESGAYSPVSRENENIFRRALRFADGYLNLTGHHCHKLPEYSEIINVPASRFLRPFNPGLKVLNRIKLRRIMKSIQYAATHGLIYQLWWHPHNFGSYTDENFIFLEKILIEYSRLNHLQKMESLNLQEIYSRTRQNNEKI